MNNKDLSGIKAFVFDLDGTLIDTEKIYRQVWPKAAADLGYIFTDEMYLKLRSMGRPFVLDQFREWFDEDFDYQEARRIRKGYFDEYIQKHPIEKKKGAIELLTFLREKGIVTAIATATDPQRAHEYLKSTGLEGYFDKVLSATMVDEGKPSPKVYLYAAKELGFKPQECVAVEDAPNGVLSASRAGFTVIMVPDQSEPDEELMKIIDIKADSLDEIIEYMQRN